MKKFIIAPDSFKGTVSAEEICLIGGNAIRRIIPGAEVISLPIADGGEGTADCFRACLGGERIELLVKGPHFDKVCAHYTLSGKTAVVEIAAAASLPMAGDDNDPSLATTYGVGELIADAVSRGASKIILALGGSATNDAGCGLAAALGVRFSDKDGKEFIPVGGSLSKIADIDVSKAEKLLNGVEVLAMCDVDNPLFGESGAAYVFAPQKGADDDMVRLLDDNLRAFSDIVSGKLKKDVSSIRGGGAAGGAGAGASVFLGAKLRRGIDTILDVCKFDSLLKDAELVITGEGRIDSQTSGGKAISGISERAKKAGVPVAVIAGDIGDGVEKLYDIGISFILSTNRVAKSFSETKPHAKRDLELTFETLARIIKCRFVNDMLHIRESK